MKAKKLQWIACLLVATGLTLCFYAVPSDAVAVTNKGGVIKPAIAVLPQTREAERETPTLDDLFAEVCRQVPAFGGMFIGQNQMLQVYLLDPAQSAPAEAAIIAVFGRERLPQGGIQVLQGQYGFLQLKAWHDRQRLATLALPGVLMTSIAESKNRLQIGVKDAGAIPRVENELFNLGVPREAVEFVVTAPTEFLQTLQSKKRPLLGGLQIQLNGGGTCTMGFMAVRQGQAGFVTNSHCTNTQGGVEGTVYFQALNSNSTDRIGVEVADPQYTSGGSCPSGRVCRASDTAFIARNSGPSQSVSPSTASFNYLASPNNNSLTIGGKFEVTSEAPFPFEGEWLSKVGRTTGHTQGEVVDTCVDINAFQNGNDTGITLLCQDRVQANNGKGDSGSPVFTWDSASLPPGAIPPAQLYGILWGGNGTTFSFSAMADMQANGELGQLKTFPQEAGANSPPEVKIMKPASGASVGIGGLNGVQFQAEVVDYEGCCTQVTWQSNLDGLMGQGTSLDYTFTSPGTRTVVVTATDNNGATASHSIVVTASNSAPTVSIIKPTQGQTLYKGVTYVFEGDSYDTNEQFFKLPCSSLKWTSSNAGDAFPKWGCTPQVSFSSTGTRTITLTGTDSEGSTDTASVTINVVNQPVNGPPVVTILNPKNNYFLDPYSFVLLQGTANDPDNKSPLTYVWKIKDGTTWTTLGTGTMNDEQTIIKFWKPANNVPFSCGGGTVRIYLYATDLDGLTGSAYVDVYIGYPVC